VDNTPTPDPGYEPELLDAISKAARHVGAGEGKGGNSVLRFDAIPGGRRRLLVLLVTLAVVMGGATYLSLRTHGDPAAIEQEEDLRWAVAQVVKRVESVLAQTGRLPTAEELHGLVSELITYERVGDSYFVVGERGEVQVLYDGSIPLDEWMTRSADPPSP